MKTTMVKGEEWKEGVGKKKPLPQKCVPAVSPRRGMVPFDEFSFLLLLLFFFFFWWFLFYVFVLLLLLFFVTFPSLSRDGFNWFFRWVFFFFFFFFLVSGCSSFLVHLRFLCFFGLFCFSGPLFFSFLFDVFVSGSVSFWCAVRKEIFFFVVVFVRDDPPLVKRVVCATMVVGFFSGVIFSPLLFFSFLHPPLLFLKLAPSTCPPQPTNGYSFAQHGEFLHRLGGYV